MSELAEWQGRLGGGVALWLWLNGFVPRKYVFVPLALRPWAVLCSSRWPPSAASPARKNTPPPEAVFGGPSVGEILYDKLGEKVAGGFRCGPFLWGVTRDSIPALSPKRTLGFKLSCENELFITRHLSRTSVCRKTGKESAVQSGTRGCASPSGGRRTFSCVVQKVSSFLSSLSVYVYKLEVAP